MTGLGYYGSSSSSSSSNLSPLAPPFTVDRSNHNKPVVNTNPISHFTDLSYPHSTAAGQQFFSDSSTATRNYGLIASDFVVNSRNWSGLSSNGLGQVTQVRSNWSDVNLSPSRVADELFYNHPYVKNEGVPLVRFSESNETDYTRNLIGLEYSHNPSFKQEGVSSRPLLPEEKRVEKMKKDDGFLLGEGNTAAAASFAYNSYLNQGAYGTESLSKGKDDSGMLYYADMIRRANNNGKSDSASFFANNHVSLDSNDFTIEESHFRAFPVYSESHSSLTQSPEDPFWNSQKLTLPPYEKRYRHTFEDIKPTTKSIPIVIKPPAASVSTTLASSKSLSITDVVGTSRKSLKEKDELDLPQLSFQVGTTSSIKDTKLSPASDQLNFEFKAKPSLPDINIPDATSSFDQHNPAEDSPCWKGTPSLPFGFSETQPSSNKLQKSTSIHGTDGSLDGKTSSSPILFHADHGKVVDSLKVRDGGDDASEPNKGHGYDGNSNTTKPKLPNVDEAARLLAETYGEAGDTKVNTSVLVKAICDLSDLLLRACSNEALKEHDHEALDRVTRNLGVCMSSQVAAVNKLLSPDSNVSQELQAMNESSGTLQDGEKHTHYQMMKSVVSGENVKNLLEHASPRNWNPPKGDNMVQAIKKVLEENLECELEPPSETTLLYKDLWLEAEAELCCLSYRARFERLKRVTQKENPHKPTATGDASAIKETSRSCNNNMKVSNAQHSDDVINVNGGQNHVKEGHVTRVANAEVTGSGVTVQHQVYKGDDVDPWVMARLNILKQREALNAVDLEEAGAREEEAAAAVGSGSDWEHILKDEVSWRLS